MVPATREPCTVPWAQYVHRERRLRASMVGLAFSVKYLPVFNQIVLGGKFPMAVQHPPRFVKIVEDAKTRVRETTVDEVKARLDRGDKFVLVDVREESELQKAPLPNAV